MQNTRRCVTRLLTGQCTNHDNPSSQSSGGELTPSDLACDLTKALALVGALAHLRNERISRMRDDGADNTGEVTRSKGNAKLDVLGVGLLGCGKDVSVEHLDDTLEEEELGHGVGDLWEIVVVAEMGKYNSDWLT
jgi:hypothetical protein